MFRVVPRLFVSFSAKNKRRNQNFERQTNLCAPVRRVFLYFPKHRPIHTQAHRHTRGPSIPRTRREPPPLKRKTPAQSSLEHGECEGRTVRKFAGRRELELDLFHAPVSFELPPPVVVATPFFICFHIFVARQQQKHQINKEIISRPALENI